MSSNPKNRFATEQKVIPLVEDDKKTYNQEKSIKQTILRNLNYIALIGLAISVYYYILSLKGCFDTMAECLKNLNEGDVRELLSYVIRCSFILALLSLLCLYKYISKAFLILISTIYGYLCFYHDTGSHLDYHGSYNRLVLALLFVMWFIGLSVVVLLYKAFNKARLLTIISVLTIAITFGLTLSYSTKYSCSHWTEGFNGTRISFDNMPCSLKTPKVCWIDMIGSLFHYSHWLGDDCEKLWNGDKELYDKIMKKNNPNYVDSKLFGFPRTENWSFDDSIHHVYDIKIMDNMIDMMDPTVPDEVKNRTEVMIDFREKKSQVIIRIVKNEEVVKLRQSYYLKFGKNFVTKNTLIIYIDAISRTHFFRTMKKTVKWMERFYKTGDPKFSSYQFFKYHALGYFTEINTVPAFFGKWWLEAGGNNYVKFFKNNGAMTGDAVSPCSRHVMTPYNHDLKNLNWESYDHLHSPLFCDPNFNQADNPYTPFLGPYSIRRRCLHGKDTTDYQTEYALKFWETYSDMPKLMRLVVTDAHEGTGNVIRYFDDKLEKFLSDMETSGKLDDTFVILMADHGNNMPGFISMMNSDDYNIEKYLPMMFMIVPNSVNEEYRKALAYNEQSFVTSWDIHNTLLNIAGAAVNSYNMYGTSLLKKIPAQRFSCDKFGIRNDFCVCPK
jgi:hypothetical protein